MEKRYLHRSVEKKLKTLFNNFACVIITGARQVGKTTLLKKVFPDLDIVIFDPVVDVENARRDPELFLNNRPAPIILDEIQYASELVPTIKRKIDENNSPGQFLIAGSQQWGVLKNVAESLAGRAVFLDLHGFSLCEIVDRDLYDKPWLASWLDGADEFIRNPNQKIKLPFTTYEHLWRGFLPQAQFLESNLITPFHQGYQRTYIERDIRLLAEVSDFQLFNRFVRLVTALTAQEINYNQIGRELGLSPTTAKRWLSLLRETFQWYEVPAYKGNMIKRVSTKPKGYWSDTGQICFTQSIPTPVNIGGHPMWGALFETAVVNEIRKQCSFLDMPPNMYYWRSHGGAECDLILERNGKYYPIEIKAKSNVSKMDTRGITSFRNTYSKLNVEKGLIIAPTERFQQVSENDYAIPWNTI